MDNPQSISMTETKTKPLVKTYDGTGKNIVLGITGTSGAIYGLRMLRALIKCEYNIDLILTDFAQFSLINECNVELTPNNISTIFPELIIMKSTIKLHNNLDLKAELFRNDYECHGMVICPCAMGILGGIANGEAKTLIEKSADYAMSYRTPFVVVPRETPINKIHLENMMRLQENGAKLVPAMPAFDFNPRDFNDLADYIAGRVLELLNRGSASMA